VIARNSNHAEILRGRKRPDQAARCRARFEAGGLSALLSEETKARARAAGKGKWSRHTHPRGALGLKFSAEAIEKISAGSKRRWQSMSEQQKADQKMKMMRTRAANGTMCRPRPNTSWKAGWREIGGVRKYFRSRWEANYARYLEFLRQTGNIRSWEHEPETFWFEGVRRGSCSYLPDFRVGNNDGSKEYHEVKGWMDARSATKLRRMKKYHPTVVVVLIDSSAYKAIQRKARFLVKDWE